MMAHYQAAPDAIVIQDVEVNFTSRKETFQVLERTSLRLTKGRFTSLIGPSGCGKSTLLNLVAGFIKANAGEVSVNARRVAGPAPDVGVIFQQYALFPWLTALGNVTFALKRLSLPKQQARELACKMLADVGLHGKELLYPYQLSGGMKQRVAIARTLISSPSVLLLDEPFAALDAITRRNMHELLLHVCEKYKLTVIFVTHDIDEAIVLSDRILVMASRPGRVVMDIDLQAIKTQTHDQTAQHLEEVRARVLQSLVHDSQFSE